MTETTLNKKQSLLNKARRLEKKVAQMMHFTEESVKMLMKANQLRSKAHHGTFHEAA